MSDEWSMEIDWYGEEKQRWTYGTDADGNHVKVREEGVDNE